MELKVHVFYKNTQFDLLQNFSAKINEGELEQILTDYLNKEYLNEGEEVESLIFEGIEL